MNGFLPPKMVENHPQHMCLALHNLRCSQFLQKCHGRRYYVCCVSFFILSCREVLLTSYVSNSAWLSTHLNIHYNHTTSCHHTVLQKCYVIARLLFAKASLGVLSDSRLYDYILSALARTNCPHTSKTLMLVLLHINWLLLLCHG
jgi:hypothetical protein